MGDVLGQLSYNLGIPSKFGNHYMMKQYYDARTQHQDEVNRGLKMQNDAIEQVLGPRLKDMQAALTAGGVTSANPQFSSDTLNNFLQNQRLQQLAPDLMKPYQLSYGNAATPPKDTDTASLATTSDTNPPQPTSDPTDNPTSYKFNASDYMPQQKPSYLDRAMQTVQTIASDPTMQKTIFQAMSRPDIYGQYRDVLSGIMKIPEAMQKYMALPDNEVTPSAEIAAGTRMSAHQAAEAVGTALHYLTSYGTQGNNALQSFGSIPGMPQFTMDPNFIGTERQKANAYVGNLENESKNRDLTTGATVNLKNREGWGKNGGSYVIPQNLQGAFQAASAATGVPVNLLHSIAVTENSNFNPLAQSPTGARGIMQLMPGTASDMGVKDVNDPAQNILGGAKYFKSLLDRYGGNTMLAIAAYHDGPGAIDKIIQQNGGKTDWASIAPGMTQEGQDYVPKVYGAINAGPAKPKATTVIEKENEKRWQSNVMGYTPGGVPITGKGLSTNGTKIATAMGYLKEAANLGDRGRIEDFLHLHEPEIYDALGDEGLNHIWAIMSAAKGYPDYRDVQSAENYRRDGR